MTSTADSCRACRGLVEVADLAAVPAFVGPLTGPLCYGHREQLAALLEPPC